MGRPLSKRCNFSRQRRCLLALADSPVIGCRGYFRGKADTEIKVSRGSF